MASERRQNKKSKRRNTREVWVVVSEDGVPVREIDGRVWVAHTKGLAEEMRCFPETVVRYVPAKGSRRG